MKVIDIGKNMILREQKRTIDRDTNMINIYLSLEPLFGATFDAEKKKMMRIIPVQIAKDSHNLLWERVKDASNDELMFFIMEMFNEILQTTLNFNKAEANPKIRLAAQEYVNNEIIHYFKDTDLKGFNDCLQRTAQSAVHVPMENPYEAEYERIAQNYPTVELSSEIEKLLGLDIVLPFKLINTSVES